MFSSSLEDRKKLASEIGRACREVGFFYAKNHNVSRKSIDGVFKAVEEFFNLPLEEKMQCHTHLSPVLRGYEPLYETNLDGKTASKGGKPLPFFLSLIHI